MCVCASMTPTYRYSASSPMPFDLNEDQNHHFFTTNTNHQYFSSTSSSSLSYPPLIFNPDQDHHGERSYNWEDQPQHLQSDHEVAEKIIVPSSGSLDKKEAEKDGNKSGIKLKVLKKKDGNNNENLRQGHDDDDDDDDGSVKWMSSKMRMIRRIMVPPDQPAASNMSANSNFKFEKPKQPLSPLATDNSSNNSSINNNITVRVCSDCHTTKTPLWRSGPRGPKSLCNACGIRQRKARRAMAAAAAAAAASANGTIAMASETPYDVKGKKLHKNKQNKLKGERTPQLKRKRKLGANKPSSRGRKKFGFEDLMISLSKKALQVFPQDEKEAAILLMALSYGLLHGFPSDRYLD